MEKRAVLAFIISILIIFLYLYLLQVISPPHPPPEPKPPEGQEPVEERPLEVKPTPTEPVEPEPIKKPQPTKKDEKTKPTISIKEAPEKETILDSPLLRAKFTSRGASLKEVTLLQYQNVAKTGPLVLLKPFSSEVFSLALSSLEPEADLHQAHFELTEQSERRIVYRIALSTGLEITKEFVLAEDDYRIDLTVTVRNADDEEQKCSFRLYSGVGIEPEAPQAADVEAIVATHPAQYRPTLERRHLQPAQFLFFRMRKGLSEEGETFFREGIAASGLVNKYFGAMLIPVEPSKIDKATISRLVQEDAGRATPEGRPNLNARADMDVALELAPGAQESLKFTFFVGPLKEDVLARHPTISGLLDYGRFLGFFSRSLLVLLRLIYKGIPNYGVAIIILTAIVRVILHPLTRKAQVSMHKMQRVQTKIAPRLKELQEKYKGDRQRLGQEQMRLFKEEGVNPASGCLGGCLPMLFQFPVFIGLFRALSIAIDLRQEPFVLWIDDLSRPDALFHLPFRLPFLGTTAVNILPILMVISWVMQSKLTPHAAAIDERARQQQKMMTLVLPLVFGILCYSFPSGVVLYWLAVTASSGLEQYLIKRKLVEEDEPLPVKGTGRRQKPGKRKRRS
ncbi:MAG: hypothetical protein AMS15_06885 [Planctomycetes bacterium DG_23]|nr:MAG: hypothetical protein AMS15_06885 [Planctomycetes bacterium DG_23]